MKNEYEQILIEEIKEFPEDKLPFLLKLVRFARSELFIDEKKAGKVSLKSVMGSFKGYLSTTEEFIARKKEEKDLDL
jgi:hypothetical protein